MRAPLRAGALLRHACRCLLVALALVGGARGVAAHAVLVESAPPDGAVLAAAPAEIRLVFNEPVAPVVVRLLDSAGNDVAGTAVEAADRTIVLRLDGELPTGAYVVSYRVTSQDSHAVAGSILFAVGAAAAGPQPAAAATADGWRIAVGVNRFLWIGLTLAAAGLAIFLMSCGRLMPSHQTRRIERRLQAAAAAALPLALLSIGLIGGLLLDAPARALLDADTWRVGGGTTLAYSMAVGVAGLAALLASSRLRSARAVAALRSIGILLVAASFGLTGHAATAAPAIAMGPAVAAHAALAAFWWGGLLGLGAALRGMDATAAAPMVRRFSATAIVAVPALLACGLAVAVVQVGHPHALVEPGYGPVLCGKLLLAAALLAAASYNRWRLLPRLAGGDASALRSLRRSVRLETALVLAVFAATALLGQLPPPRIASASLPAAIVAEGVSSQGGTATLEVSPGRAGSNEISVRLTDAGGQALAAREAVLVASLPSAGIEPIRRPLHEVGAGRYHLPELVLPVPGRWSLRIEALVSDFDKRSFALEVEIR